MNRCFLLACLSICGSASKVHPFVSRLVAGLETQGHTDSDGSLIITRESAVPAMREKTRVRGLPLVSGANEVESFSAFVETNKTAGSSLFFWYFPALNNNPEAPIILWLQGGYGSSSMFGLLVEHGAYELAEDLSGLSNRAETWNQEYAMLYIDNPAGTGFAYTQSSSGLATNQDDVANGLYAGLQIFFDVFPEKRDDGFVVCGESMAGKYVPSISAKIVLENKRQPLSKQISFRAFCIGNGLVDPATQGTYFADMSQNIGLTDEMQANKMRGMAEDMLALIAQAGPGDYNASTLLNGMPDVICDATGSSNVYDMRSSTSAKHPDFATFLNRSEIRRALHVGYAHYYTGQQSAAVYKALFADFARSVKSDLPGLLEEYEGLFYNGMFDILVGPRSTELMLASLQWSGAKAWPSAPRHSWKAAEDDTEVAGFVRNAGSLTHVTVKNAGHMAPRDQPRAVRAMLTSFMRKVMGASPRSTLV